MMENDKLFMIDTNIHGDIDLKYTDYDNLNKEKKYIKDLETAKNIVLQHLITLIDTICIDSTINNTDIEGTIEELESLYRESKKNKHMWNKIEYNDSHISILYNIEEVEHE